MLNPQKLLTAVSDFKLGHYYNNAQRDEINQAEKLICQELLIFFSDIKNVEALRNFGLKKSFKINESLFSFLKPNSEFKAPYKVLAVDGSQIYPDRHKINLPVGLVSSSAVLLNYSENGSWSEFETKLKIIGQENTLGQPDKELIDLERDLLELELAAQMADKQEKAPLLFFDGSFSFLVKAFERNTAQAELNSVNLGAKFFELISRLVQNYVLVFYTSRTFSSELPTLLREFFCKAPYFEVSSCAGVCGEKFCSFISHKNESDLLNLLLPEWSSLFLGEKKYLEREFVATKIVFLNTAKNKKFSSSINFQGESVKVELLGTKLGNCPTKLNEIIDIIFDQIKKGHGYPCSLLYAHKEAVIEFSEHEFFYSLIEGATNRSQKLVSKQ